MSRGHGEVQRTILAAVHRFDSLQPLVSIAKMGGYDPAELAVRQSFRRAARRLRDAGQVDLYTVRAPTAVGLGGPTNRRRLLCACRPGLTVWRADGVAARAMAARAYGIPDGSPVGEALPLLAALRPERINDDREAGVSYRARYRLYIER
jgi:hypothetical protein